MVTGAQIRMARAGLGWTIHDLAERSRVHRDTIARLEGGSAGDQGVLDAVRAALEAGGVVFIEDGAASSRGGPGVRLKGKRNGYLTPEQLTSETDD